MPTIESPRPEAVALAERVMAERRRDMRPLPPAIRAGWRECALANGYGVGGAYLSTMGRGYHKPKSVEAEAGWLIWFGEGWGATRRAASPIAREDRREAAHAG